MNLLLLIRKRIFAFLLLSGLLFGKDSWSNPGIVQHPKTFVLDASQYPKELRRYNPAEIYLLYDGKFISTSKSNPLALFFREDTIINLKGFADSLSQGIKGYRLIFENHNFRDSSFHTITASGPKIFLIRPNFLDSVWQVDSKFRITDKAYASGEFLKIFAYDSAMKVVDNFVYNYQKKYILPKPVPWEIILASLLREYRVYDSYDRNNYAVGAVWILSIGIDDYGPEKYKTCKTDAQSYVEFFKNQYKEVIASPISASLFHEYVLLDKDATKEAILAALKDIARKAAFNDYFIFNFSGCSNQIKNDPVNGGTNFFPYDVVVLNQTADHADLKNRNSKDTSNAYRNCIPLKILQEYIQLIPANNQLFISEAGPSGKFKTEFIKTLMQNSPEVASLLNKNRIVIVPNGFGMDAVTCQGSSVQKGPINYYITSLDSSHNIYDLFREGSKAVETAFSIKAKEFTCQSFSYNYFDIFFEKQFLQDYKEIFGDGEGQTRGIKVKSKEIEETVSSLIGKHYALIVGTDNYKSNGWKKLSNPVKDAQAVADELSRSYGFEVQLLEDKPMDSIYKAIREYYRIAKPNDQLVLYFAGHGDEDEELLSEGFIVCNDSKSIEDDPVRNTYIPYTKLKKMLNNIPARQILVLLDVCHGGTIDDKAFDNEGEIKGGTYADITNRNVLQTLKNKLPLRTRKFLSSVGTELAFDGQAGQHSPFASRLLEILRTRGGGTGGIMTINQIYAALETLSLNETATLQIFPHMADFGNVSAYNEFIFIPTDKATAKE